MPGSGIGKSKQGREFGCGDRLLRGNNDPVTVVFGRLCRGDLDWRRRDHVVLAEFGAVGDRRHDRLFGSHGEPIVFSENRKRRCSGGGLFGMGLNEARRQRDLRLRIEGGQPVGLADMDQPLMAR